MFLLVYEIDGDFIVKRFRSKQAAKRTRARLRQVHSDLYFRIIRDSL
jgi:hypothetical protein